MRAAVDDGVAQLGRLDIVLANAGVFEIQPALELTDEAWREMIDINLTGVWNTCKVALPHLIEGGRGGAIVLTSSTAGLKGTPEHDPLHGGQARRRRGHADAGQRVRASTRSGSTACTRPGWTR